MLRIKDVSWFRLIVFVGLSVVTQLAIFLNDDIFTRGEMTIVVIQSLITAFSYMQCPDTHNMARRNNDNARTKS